MFLQPSKVRQTLFAALLFLPHAAVADVIAQLDQASGAVVVNGLDGDSLAAVLAEPGRIHFQDITVKSGRGMLVKMTRDNDELHIKPKFPLRPGESYALHLSLPDGTQVERQIALPETISAAPLVVRFAPAQDVIPANVLRFYVTFSQPMAAGQTSKTITLFREDGSLVSSPFLNLETELWDSAQTRLTLILDPGRVKQGVGPNMAEGAPLQPGERYKLVVSGTMLSAEGMALGADHNSAFQVGPANRSAIKPDNWKILLPAAGTRSALTVNIDRLLDDGAAHRLLRILDGDGLPVTGQVEFDGLTWSFTPRTPWQPGNYQLMIDPELEDVSGNTTGATFDAPAGTIGQVAHPTFINFLIE